MLSLSDFFWIASTDNLKQRVWLTYFVISDRFDARIGLAGKCLFFTFDKIELIRTVEFSACQHTSATKSQTHGHQFFIQVFLREWLEKGVSFHSIVCTLDRKGMINNFHWTGKVWVTIFEGIGLSGVQAENTIMMFRADCRCKAQTFLVNNVFLSRQHCLASNGDQKQTLFGAR